MAVLIPIDMPEKCIACPLVMETNYYNAENKLWCRINKLRSPWDGRQDNCPMKDVPPHGRLIDATALNHEYYKNPSYPNLCKALNNAPTIIEASE